MFYGASGTRRLAEKALGGRVGVKLFPGSRLGAIPLIDGIRLAEVRGVGRLLCRCGSRRSCPRAVRRNGIRKACSTIGRAVWAVRQIGVSRCSNASRRTTEARGRLSDGVYAPPNRPPRAPASRVCCFAPRVPPMHFSRYRRGKRGSSQTPEGKNIPFRRFSGSERKTSPVREQEHRRTAQRCLFGPGAPGIRGIANGVPNANDTPDGESRSTGASRQYTVSGADPDCFLGEYSREARRIGMNAAGARPAFSEAAAQAGDIERG